MRYLASKIRYTLSLNDNIIAMNMHKHFCSDIYYATYYNILQQQVRGNMYFKIIDIYLMFAQTSIHKDEYHAPY